MNHNLPTEFLFTIIWSYGSCWTFGAPLVFPPETRTWNGEWLFFLWCVAFYEFKTPSLTNPAYWMKEYAKSVLTAAPGASLPWRRVWRLTVTDSLGWVVGLILYMITLFFLRENFAFDNAVTAPDFPKEVSWSNAVFSEFVVTFLTICATPFVRYLGVGDARLGNLISSFLGVQIMIWGIPRTGAVMNPASSFASTVMAAIFKPWLVNARLLSRVLFVYILTPLVAGFAAGVMEVTFFMGRPNFSYLASISGPASEKRGGKRVEDEKPPQQENGKESSDGNHREVTANGKTTDTSTASSLNRVKTKSSATSSSSSKPDSKATKNSAPINAESKKKN